MRKVFSHCTVVSPVNYGQQPTPDGMVLQPTSLFCWPSPWPPGSQSTRAHSLWAATSALRSPPIYCEWMGLSGRGEFCCFLFFWRHVGNLLLPVLLEALGQFCCFLVPLEALFWRQFSWWKVTFFLSSLHGALSFICILCLVFFGSLSLFSPVST